MSRVLSLFVYFFRWQRIMAWTSATGFVFMLAFFFLPPEVRTPVLIAGAGMAFGFPLSFAGISFRQLISNRRLALVPRLRVYAAAAMLLLSVCGALTVLAAALSAAAYPPGGIARNPTVDPGTVALYGFALISGYVLISQWLATWSAGLVALVLLPLIVLRIAFIDDAAAIPAALSHWSLTALAAAGWIWLFAAMRRGVLNKPLAAPRWGGALASDPDNPRQWHPDLGRIASAPGTLLRGFRDSLQSRLLGIALALLLFPVTMIAVLWVLGAPPIMAGEPGSTSLATIGFFLLWSLFGVAVQASMTFREWPARLRYLWLREAGDRSTAWKFLDRTLLRELVLVTLATGVIAGAIVTVTGDPSVFYLYYVAGCVALTALASYFGFLSRASGWHSIADVIFAVVLILTLTAMVFVLSSVTPDTFSR